MIKARGTSKGRDTLFLGLSEGNLTRLREDKPAHIWAEEMGLPFDIIILWGETEDVIAKKLIGPETVVHDKQTRKVRQ